MQTEHESRPTSSHGRIDAAAVATESEPASVRNGGPEESSDEVENTDQEMNRNEMAAQRQVENAARSAAESLQSEAVPARRMRDIRNLNDDSVEEETDLNQANRRNWAWNRMRRGGNTE